MLTKDVEQGIAEIRASFADHAVAVEEDGSGGAYVVVDGLDFGPRFAPGAGWIGFHLGLHYPAADVYPHFAPRLARTTGGDGLPAGLAHAEWRGRPATQISRKSNGRCDDADTAAIKLTKVIRWLRAL